MAGCSSVTNRQLIADGKQPLSGQELHEMIGNNGLHLEAIDFDAKIQFLPDGHLAASDLNGTKEIGKWQITPENELCIKFDRWYFGDLNCYTIFREKNSYAFFTRNGARYYSGTAISRTSGVEEIQTIAGKNQKVKGNTSGSHGYVNDRSARSRPTQAENKHTLLNLARNCPDCKLSGVDLRGANLIAANLTGADLSGADLSDANLRRANLAGANLSGAKLVRTNLTGADLTGSDLSQADLTGSNLIRAIVTNANLDGTIFSDAHLESIEGMKY